MSQTTIKSGGSLIASASFKDEQNQAVVPTTITWTLTDGRGNVINDRLDIPIAVPAATVSIVLGPADNPALDEALRIITFIATYLSSMIPGQEMQAVEQSTYYVKSIVEPVEAAS